MRVIPWLLDQQAESVRSHHRNAAPRSTRVLGEINRQFRALYPAYFNFLIRLAWNNVAHKEYLPWQQAGQGVAYILHLTFMLRDRDLALAAHIQTQKNRFTCVFQAHPMSRHVPGQVCSDLAHMRSAIPPGQDCSEAAHMKNAMPPSLASLCHLPSKVPSVHKVQRRGGGSCPVFRRSCRPFRSRSANHGAHECRWLWTLSLIGTCTVSRA